MDIKMVARKEDTLQKPVANEQLIKICETAFQRIPITEVIEISGGLFNNTFMVLAGGDKFILRISPHSDVRMSEYEQMLMRREYNIQPYFMPMGRLFPKTVFADFSRRICDRDYVVQTFLEGTNWEEIKRDLSQEDNDRIWYEVGMIAKEICNMTSDLFGPPSPAKQFDTWSGYLTNFTNGMRTDMKLMGFIYDEVDTFMEQMKNYNKILNSIRKPRLVHGDLWEKNILIVQENGKWGVSGVLDSERAYWGDEISEWIHTFINVSPTYWEGYGSLFYPEHIELRHLIYAGVNHIMAATETRLRYGKDPNWALKGLASITERLKLYNSIL